MHILIQLGSFLDYISQQLDKQRSKSFTLFFLFGIRQIFFKVYVQLKIATSTLLTFPNGLCKYDSSIFNWPPRHTAVHDAPTGATGHFEGQLSCMPRRRRHRRRPNSPTQCLPTNNSRAISRHLIVTFHPVCAIMVLQRWAVATLLQTVINLCLSKPPITAQVGHIAIFGRVA